MLRRAPFSVVGTSVSRKPPKNVPPKVFIHREAPPDGRGLRPEQRNIAVKDNIATGSDLTTCASHMLQLYQSPFEAGVVQELRRRRAFVVGKTNLDEFGMGSHSTHSFFGPVTNAPHNDRSAGGSSGGSAVAVAIGECGMALGTDTGGSVRLPAAYTGIVGFKPSYGCISRWGVVPYANSLDTVGILAPSAKNVDLGLICASHFDVRDPTSLTESTRARLTSFIHINRRRERRRRIAVGQFSAEEDENKFSNLRIGIPMEYNIEELQPGVRAVWRNVLEFCQDKGATLVPLSLPNTKHALSAYYILAPAEAASNLSKYDGVRYGTRGDGDDGTGHVLFSHTRDGFGEEVKRRILLGSYTLSSEAKDNYFLQAQRVRRLVQRDFDRVFAIPNPLRPMEQFDLSDLDDSTQMQDKLGPAQVDCIVCPTAPTTAPRLDDISEQSPVDTYMNDVFTVPASLAGLPAISIPFLVPRAFQEKHAPNYAGIQIIGQFANDSRVIAIAQRLEKYREEVGKSKGNTETNSPPIRKTLIDGGVPFPFPPGKKLLFRTNDASEPTKDGANLTATLNVRRIPTNGRGPRDPVTDAEIDQAFQGALDTWERIKQSEAGGH